MIAYFPFEEEIPQELLKLIGLITIRCGHLERILMNVYHRVFESQRDILEVVAELKKEQKTLRNRVSQLKEEFNKRKIDIPTYLDFNELEKLAEDRNSIHDALIMDEKGAFGWLSSSYKRKHRPAALGDLKTFYANLDKAIYKITADKF